MSAEDKASAEPADIGEALVAALGFEPADGRARGRRAAAAGLDGATDGAPASDGSAVATADAGDREGVGGISEIVAEAAKAKVDYPTGNGSSADAGDDGVSVIDDGSGTSTTTRSAGSRKAKKRRNRNRSTKKPSHGPAKMADGPKAGATTATEADGATTESVDGSSSPSPSSSSPSAPGSSDGSNRSSAGSARSGGSGDASPPSASASPTAEATPAAPEAPVPPDAPAGSSDAGRPVDDIRSAAQPSVSTDGPARGSSNGATAPSADAAQSSQPDTVAADGRRPSSSGGEDGGPTRSGSSAGNHTRPETTDGAGDRDGDGVQAATGSRAAAAADGAQVADRAVDGPVSPADPALDIAAAAAVTGELLDITGADPGPPPPSAADAIQAGSSADPTVVVDPSTLPSGPPAHSPSGPPPAGPPVAETAAPAVADTPAPAVAPPATPEPVDPRIENRSPGTAAPVVLPTEPQVSPGAPVADPTTRLEPAAVPSRVGEVVRRPSLPDFFRRKRRVQARKVRRVVRHIDPWSVLTFSVLFHLCVFGALLLASVLVWNAAEAAGTLQNLEDFIQELGDYESFEIKGEVIFRAAVAIAGILTLASSVLLVLLTVVFNLISDLVGGIRLTVIEEETIRVRRKKAA